MGRLSDLFVQSTTPKPQDDKRGRLAAALNANIATQNAELGSDLITAIPKAAQKTYDNPSINAAIGFTPVLGDIQSGYEAQKEARAGNYGTAALNAVGVLPFVPALGALVGAKAILGKAAGPVENLSPLAKGLRDQQGMIAYHGSPHKFDKFDMSKIGTGEGAQAYGHGLYLAEAPAVAQEYAGALSAAKATKPVGNVDLTQAYQNLPNDVPETLLAARRDFRALTDAGELSTADRRDFLTAVNNNLAASKNGQLYKTDIPDEAVARFLDWDKPLSQQAPEVQAAWQQFTAKNAEYLSPDVVGGQYKDPTGKDFYSAVFEGTPGMGEKARAEVTNQLQQIGLPGIRYLDGGSRGAGKGSSNFVVFDDAMPRILERNGVPTGLEPWAPGEWVARK